jgi:hypothetical protein
MIGRGYGEDPDEVVTWRESYQQRLWRAMSTFDADMFAYEFGVTRERAQICLSTNVSSLEDPVDLMATFDLLQYDYTG